MSFLSNWPVLKQIRAGDLLGLGESAKSHRSATLEPRTKSADRIVKSICPYCAVGCGQNVYVKNERLIDIEGDPDSPISVGRLCPKGSARFNLSPAIIDSKRCFTDGPMPPNGRRSRSNRPWIWWRIA